MNKHTLFVCKSCHRSSEKLSENQLPDGTRLLEQLNTLSTEKFSLSQLEIQPVGCMWACSHGCVAAISSQGKPTYLLVDLPTDESAAGLLEIMQMYIYNNKGTINYKKLKELLKCATFIQVPPVVVDENAE
ncbi:MAG: DUF1636 family protein [Goleter apudmare HA4340-LM2]|jgi:predicted metal-binding protein|nr:DUF1636 family protein [Goleter apudmare HA4340-LM2]